MSDPTTEAGKRWLAAATAPLHDTTHHGGWDRATVTDALAAIEAEAKRAALAEAIVSGAISLCGLRDCRWQVVGPHHPHGPDDYSQPVYMVMDELPWAGRERLAALAEVRAEVKGMVSVSRIKTGVTVVSFDQHMVSQEAVLAILDKLEQRP